MALAIPSLPPPSLNFSACVARGIPPNMLLDRQNRFVPRVFAEFVLCVALQEDPVFYWEFEVIWQAVSLPSWTELTRYLGCVAVDLQGRISCLSQERSYNFLSPRVLQNWKELRYLRTKVDPDNERLYRHSAIGIHLLRERFITWTNARKPNLEPLRSSDNLRVRLRRLPSMALHRKLFQEHNFPESAPWSGSLTKQEKRHLRRFGVQFDSEPGDIDWPPSTLPMSDRAIARRKRLAESTPAPSVVVSSDFWQ